jgi:hypothetical protein
VDEVVLSTGKKKSFASQEWLFPSISAVVAFPSVKQSSWRKHLPLRINMEMPLQDKIMLGVELEEGKGPARQHARPGTDTTEKAVHKKEIPGIIRPCFSLLFFSDSEIVIAS